MRKQKPVLDADPRHKIWGLFSYSTLAPSHACAVPLRVDAPPAEVCAPPLGRDSLIAATAEGQYLVGALPRILCFFEPFSALRGGFGLGSGQRSFWHSRQPCAFIADLADRDSYLLDYRTSSWDAN